VFTHKKLLWVFVITACMVLSSCAPKKAATSPPGVSPVPPAPGSNLVVLVPDPDGAVGHITVSNKAGSVDIGAANQATAIPDQNVKPGAPREMDQAEIQQLFGKAIAMQPEPPVHFILYFKSDSVDLVPGSEAELPKIMAAIQTRGTGIISIIGHTDTAGNDDYNLKLSMRRALAVKNRLVGLGADGASMDVTSHGKRNPLVKTGDNIRNEKNRRVEIVVR
jgi:outer membrane protein OmpA-like peptidoglycan-associated protein